MNEIEKKDNKYLLEKQLETLIARKIIEQKILPKQKVTVDCESNMLKI